MSQYLRALLLLCSAFFCSQAFATTYVPIQVGDITVIIPIDDPPVAVSDSFVVLEDTQTVLDVMANDSDENLSTAIVSILTNPNHGTVVLNSSDNTITYTPKHNSNEQDQFSYQLIDENNNLSEAVLVTIDITPVNDFPEISNVRWWTIPDVTETHGQIWFEWDLYEVDGNGIKETWVELQSAANGTQNLGSAPRSGDWVDGTYRAGLALLKRQTDFEVTIKFVDDNDVELSYPLGKVTFYTSNTPPEIVGLPDSINLQPGQSSGLLSFTINDDEIAAANLGVTVSSTNDSVVAESSLVLGGSGSNRTLAFHIEPNQEGNTRIKVEVSDGAITAEHSIYVSSVRGNEPPFVAPQADIVINEGGRIEGLRIALLDSGTDASNLAFSVTSNNQSLIPNPNITVRGAGTKIINITPNANSSGSALITMTASDGELSTSESFTVTVNGVNDAPVINGIANQTYEGNGSFSVPFTVSDEDTSLSNLSFTGISSNQALLPNGHISFGGSGANRTVTLSPLSGQSGNTTVAVTVSDGEASSSTSFVLTVVYVSSGPAAEDDIGSTDEDNVLTISNALLNDTGDGITITNATVPQANGHVGWNSSSITYTPLSNFNGTANITYTITDSGGLTDTATIVVTVNPINDSPVIDNSVTMPDEVTVGGTYSYQINASDVEDSSLTYSLTGAPAWLSVNTQGLISGTPAASDLGNVTGIRFSVTDSASVTTHSEPFNIEVKFNNTPPTIEGRPVTVFVAGSEYVFEPIVEDADNDTLTFSIENKPDWATFDNATGKLSGVPQLADVKTFTNIRISVSDGTDTASLAAFDIVVQQPTTPKWAETGGSAGTNGTDDTEATDSTFNGAIPGEAGVSGGGAVYNIPIVVPPGRNGVQPNVSLNFSSRSGMGIAGVGWSLSAGSSISRCPRTVAQDGINGGIQYDMNDRLCLDGQRLVPLKNAVYGEAGTTYTTEMESFVTVIQEGADLNVAGTRFTVNYPDGRQSTFGNTLDSAQSQVVATGRQTAMSWLIAKQSDITRNNTMTYHYTDYGDGEKLLSKITYTGTANTEGDREVHFGYQDAEKYSTSYLAGGMTRSTQRLKNVATYYAGTCIRRYDLVYELSRASGRPLLNRVEEHGFQNMADNRCDNDQVGQQRASTTFEWADATPKIVREVMKVNTASGPRELFPSTSKTERGENKPVNIKFLKFAHDVDGNGVRDWVHDDVSYHVNAEGTLEKEESLTEIVPDCSNSPWSQERICIEADFNVDGLTDGFRIQNNQLYIGITRLNAPDKWFNTGIVMRNGTREVGRVMNVGDYNGDGHPDLIIKYQEDTQFHIRLHTFDPSFNVSGNTAPFSSSYTNLRTILGSATREGVVSSSRDVQYVGDMNNDGLGDFAIYGRISDYFRDTLLELLITRVGDNGISLEDKDLNFESGGRQSAFAMLMDVNGDGLKDWLGDMSLKVRLNKGDGTFAPAVSLGINLPVRRVSLADLTYLEPDYGEEPRFKQSFQQVDINGDGRTELLMPGRIVVEACVDFSVKDGFVSVVETHCGSSLEQNFEIKKSGWFESLKPEMNRNVYAYQALTFHESKDGELTATLESTPYEGTPLDVLAVDAFGKGLQDFIFSYGCNNDGCSMQSPGNHTEYQNNAGKVFINRNYGSTTKASPEPQDYIPVDSLLSASNGVGINSNDVGLTSTWDYSPLSSDEYSDADNNGSDTINGGAFYDPVREDFADNEHFNFASSMYVVASFKQSNGVGTENETRYQYSGAVYNNKGRGFRGFKSITQRDIVNGTTTHTEFWQKFPFSSAVKTQTVLNGSGHAFDYNLPEDNTCVAPAIPELRGDDNVYSSSTSLSPTTPSATCQVLSQTLNLHDENPSYAAALVNGKKVSYSIYQPKSWQYTRDPSNRELISVTTSEVLAIDGYGNITSSGNKITDDYGTYETLSQGDFSNANRSWPNRYKSKTVIKKSVVRKADGLSLPTGHALDNDKVVTTEVVWDTDVRKPKDVTVKYGDNSASSTATVTSTIYNDYGLPTSVSVAGDIISETSDTKSTQTRTVTTTYIKDDTSETPQDDGYFPFEVTQVLTGNNLVTTTKTNPATGLPVEVSDVSGVVTTTTYDSLARPRTVKRSGRHTDDPARRIVFPTQYISYHAPDNMSPVHAVMQINTAQSGVPASREYKDLLGRTLRTATQSFDGTYVYQDVTYNARGLVTAESNIYPHDGTAEETTYGNFDVLGRPGMKVTPGTNGNLTTTYSYDKLKTSIVVTPDVSDLPPLSMSRTYNSLEQLMQTTDALGGVTRYAYDGAGNPVVIQDAAEHNIIAQYDALGRKNYVVDPNMGRSEFTYNDFGELEKERAGVINNEQESIIRYDMDRLGRVTERYATGEGTATFTWDDATPGLLASQTGNGATTTYRYDDAARITDTTVSINNRDYVTSTIYDGVLGRPKAKQYPAVNVGDERLTIAYQYNTTGYLTHEKNASSQFIYREITEQDALGNITKAWLNNRTLLGDYDYHHVTGQMLHSRAGLVHDVSYYDSNDVKGYDSYGNLTAQKLRIGNQYGTSTETYEYDELHRLTHSSLTYSIAGSGNSNTDKADIDYRYDAVGNIKKKTDYSVDADDAYQYHNGTNQINSIRLKDNGGTLYFGYDGRGNQVSRGSTPGSLTNEVTYNAFNKPTHISKNSQNITLSYGADTMRFKQVRVEDDKKITTWYIGKHFEVEVNELTNTTTNRHFISDVAIVNMYSNQVPQILFTHRDRLGSAITLTDENNNADVRRFFDPFGKPRVGGDWSLWSSLGLPAKLMNLPDHEKASYKGFTDHEHLDDAELIHMNGRVYDYNVGRFMSVDPVIQSPGNSQSINPYSYIMNNPLAGTDPTGYSADMEEVETTIQVGNETVTATFQVDADGNTQSVTLNGSESARDAAMNAIQNTADSISDTGSSAQTNAKVESGGLNPGGGNKTGKTGKIGNILGGNSPKQEISASTAPTLSARKQHDDAMEDDFFETMMEDPDFRAAFEEAKTELIASVRMAVSNTDFSPIEQFAIVIYRNEFGEYKIGRAGSDPLTGSDFGIGESVFNPLSKISDWFPKETSRPHLVEASPKPIKGSNALVIIASAPRVHRDVDIMQEAPRYQKLSADTGVHVLVIGTHYTNKMYGFNSYSGKEVTR